MLLASAILNSIGGFAILVGAWVQARQAYGQHTRHGDVLVWIDRNGYLAQEIAKRDQTVRVPRCDAQHFDSKLPFLPSIRTLGEGQVTFAGWFGWELIFAGGALVVAGSIIAAIAAP
jgi:hypothetical protein